MSQVNTISIDIRVINGKLIGDALDLWVIDQAVCATMLLYRALTWPFRSMQRAVYSADGTMLIEFTSGFSAICFALWFMSLGNVRASIYRAMTAHVPEIGWVGLFAVAGVTQLVAVSTGTRIQRAQAMVVSFALWLSISGILWNRQGFNIIHPLLIPLTVACFLSIFILLGRPWDAKHTTDSS